MSNNERSSTSSSHNNNHNSLTEPAPEHWELLRAYLERPIQTHRLAPNTSTTSNMASNQNNQNNHAPTSRPRDRTAAGDEEAGAELKLGEFEGVPTLTNSEARLLINAVMDHRRSTRKVDDTEVLIKTSDYLDIFARFKQKENIEAVERMLASHTELEMFERSQLGTLCCESAEEAKTLIPSLAGKIGDAELQELLDDITKLRNFVE